MTDLWGGGGEWRKGTGVEQDHSNYSVLYCLDFELREHMAYSAYYLIATQMYYPFILNMTCSRKMILDLVLESAYLVRYNEILGGGREGGSREPSQTT